MQLARDAGALVSMDLNLRPALWPRDVDPRTVAWPALASAHLVKLSREELAFLSSDGEDAALARLLDGGARVVVVTDGAAPIRWWTAGARGEAPTFAVQAIDTTAAGDAFVAGLLQAIVARGATADTLPAVFADDAMRGPILCMAAAAGALATTRHGAFAAMPSLADVHALMETAA